MIAEPRASRGSLGRRLLVAFLLVASLSVVVLTAAALVATDRGLASAHREERARVAARVADAAATGYTTAAGWSDVDLGPASALADAAGARLVVLDTDGTMVRPGRGMGPGMSGRHTDLGGLAVEAPVLVAGERVGTVRLAFATAVTEGREVAWTWVAGAALVALLAAVGVSGYVTRRLTRPLVALTTAARRFAAGERGARVGTGAPGELGEVILAFDSMADEVVRAETVRRRLSADVAHELRTPLAALQAGLEELRDGLREPDTARLAALHDQTLRLGRVVRDLAELSAAESAGLSLHPIDADLAGIARAAVAGLGPQLDAAGLRVGTDLPGRLPVRGDPDRLHQAVANLLANAARYCRPGDRVTVDGRIDGRFAVLRVRDTGPGIPAADLPHVFERLWRGQGSTVAGSGIGLAVVREIVTAHGGTVGAQSPSGQGTTVTIRLPLAAPDTALREAHGA